MPSTLETLHLIQNDVNTGHLDDVYQHYKNYAISHCLHPQKISVVDSYTLRRKVIDIPCGTCSHCVNSKINEWVTRMYAHLENYKHCYFVTLTYRSFYSCVDAEGNHVFAPNQPFYVLQYLSDALWHYDNLNHLHRYCWRPCVLVKSHYQNFLKRLRKHTKNNDITYFCAGEYGHEHGAPHFHLILFSNDPLTKADIDYAWSVKLDSKGNTVSHGAGIRYSFGRTDFHDLVTNGTLDTSTHVIDGLSLDSRSCFAYVCKYLNKSDFNNNRVKIAFDCLFTHTDTIAHVDECTYTNSKGRTITKKAYTFTKHNVFLKTDSYDFIFPDHPIELEVYSGSPFTLPTDFENFNRKFRPFTSPSRGTPIGSLFVKSHMSEFVEGKFSKPSLQNQSNVSFIVPAYFRRKTEEFVFSLRKCSAPGSFSLSNISAILQILKSSYTCINGVPHVDSFSVSRSKTDILNSSLAFKDLQTSERLIIVKSDDHDGYIVPHYLFNRSSRSYDLQSVESLEEFADRYISDFEKSYLRYQVRERLRHDNDVSLDLITKYIDNNFPDGLAGMILQVEQDFKQELQLRQDNYHIRHKYLE